MSRQASVLERAGYIAIRSGQVGQLDPHLLKLTLAGRAAFNDHEVGRRPTRVGDAIRARRSHPMTQYVD